MNDNANTAIFLICSKNKVTIEDFRSLINSCPEIMPALRDKLNLDNQNIYELVKNNKLNPDLLVLVFNDISAVNPNPFNEFKEILYKQLKPLLELFNKFAINLGF